MKIYWNGERKNVIGSRVKQLRKKQDISQKIWYDERKREAWMSEYGKKLHSF